MDEFAPPSQPTDDFHGVHYLRLNARRLEHLASLDLDLSNKTVIELGAGIGDLSTFFLDRGCKVLSIEARQENCVAMQEQHAILKTLGHPAINNWQAMRKSIADMKPERLRFFDIVFAYGLLYHLGDPLDALDKFSALCGGLLLLETCITPGEHEAANIGAEDKSVPTQSYDGSACRPTRSWILNRLGERFDHVYLPREQPAHEEFVSGPSTRNLRCVFVCSRTRLDQETLIPWK